MATALAATKQKRSKGTGAVPPIPPQGGYTAKQCPRKVSNDHDPFYEHAPRDEFPAGAVERMAEGVEFETSVRDLWVAAIDAEKIAVLDGDRSDASKQARERRTLTLMARPGKVEVIWNPRLPATRTVDGVDEIGERVSEPDFLVRTVKDTARGRWLWAPGDVKHHKVFDTGGKKTRPWQMSTLAAPSRTDAVEVEQAGVVKLADALQLAHYQRHLEWLGFDDPGSWGAVIGKPIDGDVRLVWLNLDHQVYERETATALGLYDAKFDFARQVIVRARARRDDPALLPLVGPEKRTECGECVWRTVCSDDRKDTDNITVLPGVTVDRATVHYDRGVDTIGRLARLHVPTALAVAAGVDTTGTPDVDPLTASYAGTKVFDLVGTIDRARVWRAGKPHRARGAAKVELDRMPIELDVDIEDVDGRVYLIGVQASGRARRDGGDTKSRREYRSFVTWDDTDEAQARVLAEFWEYLQTMKSYARANHWGLRLYHYGPHEVIMLTKVAEKYGGQKVGRTLTVPTVEELADLFGSTSWVDMYPIVSRQVVWPAEDQTLKSVASLCGHQWRDTDPSGSNSMAWYRNAVGSDDESERRAARKRILDYNEDDCGATLAIRDWLTKASVEGNLGQGLPSVEDLDARFAPRTV